MFWPDQDALGQCLVVSDGDSCTRVVGIVEDHRREALEEQDTGLYYLPLGHPDLVAPPQGLMVRTTGPAANASGALRGALDGLDPRVRWTRLDALESLVAPSLRSWRLGATLFAVFGLLALAIAVVGLYGVLAFEVSRRVRELGVRAALGATAADLMGMVVRSGLALAVAGIAAGLLIAGIAGRFLGPLLFHVSPWDPMVFGGVAALLLAAALPAALVPAWRTTRLDPTDALRSE